MALQKIDVDTVYPNDERGVPQRTANIITNDNMVEVEQRLVALEGGEPAVAARLDALDDVTDALTGRASDLESGLAQEIQERESAVSQLQTTVDEVELRLGLIDGRIPGKSVLINGDFENWQRGDVFTATGYCSDRWYVEMGAISSPEFSRIDVAPGNAGFKSDPDNAAKVAYTGNTSATSHYFVLHQRVVNVRTFAGRQSVLSFTVYNSGAAGRQIAVEFSQVFGTTGGSPSINALAVQKVTLSAGFNYIALQVNLPSVAGKTITANSYVDAAIWFTGGSNFNARNGNLGPQSGQLLISAVQWEAGSIATEYARVDPSQTWAMCRWYYKADVNGPKGNGTTRMNLGVGLTFSATRVDVLYCYEPMRTVPTITISPAASWRILYGGGATGATSISVGEIGRTNAYVNVGCAGRTPGDAAMVQSVDGMQSGIGVILDAEI